MFERRGFGCGVPAQLLPSGCRHEVCSHVVEMKSAFEKLREDVGEIRTFGSNTDGQLAHRAQRPALVEIRGILRQVNRPSPP